MVGHPATYIGIMARDCIGRCWAVRRQEIRDPNAITTEALGVLEAGTPALQRGISKHSGGI